MASGDACQLCSLREEYSRRPRKIDTQGFQLRLTERKENATRGVLEVDQTYVQHR